MKKLTLFLASLFLTFSAQATETLFPVVHSSTSVVHECFPLWDIGTSPEGAVTESGVTSATAGLQIRVRANNSALGWEDTFTQSGSTIEGITTIGTYAAPTATKIRFAECETGSGLYQIMMADALYATASAKSLTVEIQDTSSPAFATQVLKINLNVTDRDSLIDATFDEPCAGHVTVGTTGEVLCSDLNLIQQATTVDGVPLEGGSLTAAAMGSDFLQTMNPQLLVQTTIASAVSNTDFTLTDGSADDLVYQDAIIVITDSANPYQRAVGVVNTYTGSTKRVTLVEDHGIFSTGITDIVNIFSPTAPRFMATDTITADAIAGNAIGANEIATGAIGATEIAADAIGASEIATDAIGALEIAADAIGASEIATDAIGSGEIAANAINNSEMGTDAIGAAELGVDAVAEIVTAILAGQVEDQGTGYDLKCAMATLLAYAAGDVSTTSGVSTYQDPSATETRIVGTVSGSTRTSITITCP